MAGIPHDHYEPKTGAEKWVNNRLGVIGLVYDTMMILSLIHISEPTRQVLVSRMPSSA